MKNLLFFLPCLLIAFLSSCGGDDDGDVTPEPEKIEITAEDFAVTIEENPDNDQVLGILTASASEGEVAFAIKSQTPEGAMSINASSGELSVADSALFDFETNPSLTAVVEVSIEGADSKEVDVTITLTDIDESIEIIAENFTTTIEENPYNGQVLGSVTASASDGEVVFAIKSQTPEGAMAIDASSGELTVADSALFDFEINPTLTAVVEVSADNADSKEVDVTITLTDVEEPRPFITTWQTTSVNESITIYINPDVTGYDYQVDWGDGSQDNNLTADASHEYATAGIYTVEISGNFPAIYSANLDGSKVNAEKLQSIESWGTIEWKSMEQAFAYCSNMVYNASDEPELSQVASMASMFSYANSFNGDINNWDVSNVTDMTYMFRYARSFNQDLNSWNVSKVDRMFHMFEVASLFNGNITDWDVSNVKSMSRMFNGAYAFNQDIGSWNVSSLLYATYMFNSATTFSQDLSGWATDNVTECTGFANSSGLTQAQLPTAGTCFN